MSPQEFGTLKRYAMKMARDEDDRDEQVLQAYEEGVRLGKRRSMPLLVNFMKLRSREWITVQPHQTITERRPKRCWIPRRPPTSRH